MTILDARNSFQPFDYPWAFEAFKKHEEMHWLPNEATALPNDIDDYKNKLTEDERSLVTQILRFFTQTDIDVANGYTKVYMPKFKKPELLMAMASFAAREAIHIFAYSQVVDTLGFPDDEYNKFMDFAEMKEKHEFLWDEPWKIAPKGDGRAIWLGDTKFIPQDIVEGGRNAGYTDAKIEDLFNLAYGLAKFSGFAEGLQLFSSFAMLLNFKRFGLMKGMGSIVAWSIRDESLHVETMIKVFRELIKDFPWLWTNSFQELINDLARDMVQLEFNFIDLAYRSEKQIEIFEPNNYTANGMIGTGEFINKDIELRGLTKQDIKDFVKVTGNQRLEQLGLKPIFDVDKNPLPWFNLMIAGEEHANFFEVRGTAYGKATVDTSQINFNPNENDNEFLSDAEDIQPWDY